MQKKTYFAALPLTFEAESLEDAVAIADLCREAIADAFVDGPVEIGRPTVGEAQ